MCGCVCADVLIMQTLVLTHTDFLITVCRIQRMQIQTPENKTVSMVRERIQRLNITDTLECNCDEASCSGSNNSNSSSSSSNNNSTNPHQQLRSQVTRTNSCVEQQQQQGAATDNMPNGSDSRHVDNVLTPVEPIYAVVDLQHKYAQRKMRHANKKADNMLLLKRCNSYDSILQPCAAATAAAAAAITQPEFAHRQPYQREKSLSYTDDDIDGIYEDGDAFYQPLNGTDTITIYNTTTAAANTIANINATVEEQQQPPKTYCDVGVGMEMSDAAAATDAEAEENIYEPINMPHVAADGGNHFEAHAFWKYLTRLKVNSLLQLTRRIRSNKAGGGNNANDYDTIKYPSPTLATATDVPDIATTTVSRNGSICSSSSSNSVGMHANRPPQSDVCNNAATSSSTSHFSTIKRKFGTHRKSMQLRMRKFCTRAYEPKPLFKQHHHYHNGDCQETTAATSVNATMPNSASSHCSNGMKYTDNHQNQKTSSKLKYRWKSVKIRARNLHFPASFAHGGTTTVAATTTADAVRRKSFFDSLPHMRRARLSLFSGAHRPPASNTKASTTATKRLNDTTLTDTEN